jgi:hypothetical protein
MKVRKEIMPHARKNISKTNTAYSDIMAQYSEASAQNESTGKKVSDVMDNIIDIRYSTNFLSIILRNSKKLFLESSKITERVET